MHAVINGGSLAFDDHGNGPAVVLIHGFPLCRRMWRPQIAPLTAAGYRVVVPDLRGFGESAPPDGACTMELYADDIAGLLDHLEIDRAVVAGMSMGGYVLFNLLERHADRLAAACFVVTRSAADDMAGKARRLRMARRAAADGAGAVVRHFGTALFAPRTAQERPELVAEVRSWISGSDPRGLAGGLLAMRERKDYTPFLEGIHLPCLAVGAEDDRAVPVENARELAAAIPGCRLAIVPDAGHMANMERPAAFNDAVIAFLREVCP